MFDFQRETVKDYWQEILKRHPYYKLAKFFPSRVIRKFAIERLLKDENSPTHWIRNKDEGKVRAYFGSRENLECMPKVGTITPCLQRANCPTATSITWK